MDFIACVPAAWISRRRVAPLAPGCAPSKGPLSLASQQHVITILASTFVWLVDAGHLLRNPWVLVQKRLGDDALKIGLDPSSRAIS
jgi:hypothetical protein